MEYTIEHLRQEIAKITEATKTREKLWERVRNHTGMYRTIESQPYLAISYCNPHCWIQAKDLKITVSCEEIFELCGEIVKQIRQNTTQMAAMIESLRALNTSESR